jgi:hypothetical protein
MKKIIQLTESDLTNIVNRVIKENAAKDSLIYMIKDEGWQTAVEMVGGVENLKKLTGIETPMDYLNLFNDMDVAQGIGRPPSTLYRYGKGHNIILHYEGHNNIHIDYYTIWSFLEEGFGLKYSEIQRLTKKWLRDVYNLRRVSPSATELKIV